MLTGFTFTVDGDAAARLRKILTAAEDTGKSVQSAQKATEEAGAGMERTFERVGVAIAGVFAIDRIKDFAERIFEVTKDFEGFTNRINFASLDKADALRNMQFIREEVTKLHLPLREVTEGFSEMEAGLVGTGIQGRRLRDLFEGIGTAAATLHLSQYQLGMVQYDLKELGEVGLNRRIYMSLARNLPGISDVIKEAFGGKTFKELEDQKDISGPQFLAKLAPALAKHFSGGLAAFAESMQGKYNDMQTAFLDRQLQLGNMLKPVYINIMNSITGAMGQLAKFLSYLDRNRESIVKLIEVVKGLAIGWLVYQGAVLTTTVVSKAAVLVEKGMQLALEAQLFTVRELAVEYKALASTLTTIGWGVIAAGIGIMVEKILEGVAGFEKMQEKLYHLKAFQQGLEERTEKYDQLVTTVSNFRGLTKPEKGDVLGQIIDQIKITQAAMNEQLMPQINSLRAQIAHDPGEHKYSYTDASGIPQYRVTPDYRTVEDQRKLDATLQIYNKSAAQLFQLNRAKEIFEKSGIKESDAYNIGTGGADSANGLAGLGGAKGGLGEAKVINIKIDTVQHNDVHGVHEWEDAGTKAAENVIRAFNNLAYSQTVTM